MSLLKAIIKAVAPAPDITKFSRFLFIGPHPDDIEIGAGATAARLAAEGKDVRFLVCIDGRFGTSNCSFTPEKLVSIRKKEAESSAEFLGIKDFRMLDGFHDGALYDTTELLHALAKEIGEYNPDVVFCPDPAVTSECHADHLNVGSAVRQIACFAPYQGIMEAYGAKSADIKAVAFYMTAKANQFINTTGYLDKQLDSVFKIHLSQFPKGCDDAKMISLYLKLRAYDYGIRKFCRTAEGFRVLGATQMHCLPEFGD